MSLVSLAPALAHENNGKKNGNKLAIEMKKELKKEVKEERKEDRDHEKEVEKGMRFAPRTLTFVGKLVSVNSTSTSSTEITVNIGKVFPNRPKKMPTSTLFYPEAGKNITFKITDKTLLIKTYGGKMVASEMSVGDELRIVAKFNKDGSLDVRVIKDNSLHSLSNKKGVIESISTTSLSFMLKQDNRILTVKTNTSTKFQMKGNTSTSFASLNVGDKVTVSGMVNTNTKIVDARAVMIMKRPVTTTSTP